VDIGGGMVWLGGFVMHEVALFAATGFLLLGIGDVVVDLIWIGGALKRRLGGKHSVAAGLIEDAPRARFALFIPAWDEAAVIGRMLANSLDTLRWDDFSIYVGCYPNDPETRAAALAIGDDRVRVVTGPRPGPTTKADCLNALWAALRDDEAAGAARADAVVLHDAEDLVHSHELALYAGALRGADLVQIPVVPLAQPGSRFVSALYCDEFAEAHGKELVVRQAIGAGLPSAGVGCAISRRALDALAEAHGTPFDPASLTEDYELGLRLRALGFASAFVRARPAPGRPLVATRAYFPGTIAAAVAQRARWMTGIALAGWDRLGWSGGAAERWMRLRDRQAPLAALLLAAAYLALVLWSAQLAGALALGLAPAPTPPLLHLLLQINLVLLAWRIGMRMLFAGRVHGWRQGLMAVPRMIVGNIIAMMAARRAIGCYLRFRRTGAADWDKTAHSFPAAVPAE
jgi:bacteriophage N4 adsorption protein B